MEKTRIRLYHDNFQNYKRYGIPRAQLVIADIPYNVGDKAYGSNPMWYIGGDNKNGESKHAKSAFFNGDGDFNLITGATSSNAIQTAHNLPESSGISGGTVMADTGAYPILWHKDSADAGCLSYQLHYITNDGLIIGDGIAYHCAAVRQNQVATSAQIYFYGHRINQLTGTTDVSGHLATFPITVDTANGCLTYVGTPPEGFESWAIIKGGRFMLGKNGRVAPTNIYFNFKRRLKT